MGLLVWVVMLGCLASRSASEAMSMSVLPTPGNFSETDAGSANSRRNDDAKPGSRPPRSERGRLVPLTRDQSRAVFGQVMGLVALTLGFLALGAYIGRNMSGGWGILFFIAEFGCIFGLNIASSARERPARDHAALRPRAVPRAGAWAGAELVCAGRSLGGLAGRRRDRRVRGGARRGRLRNSPRPVLVVPRPVLGAARR